MIVEGDVEAQINDPGERQEVSIGKSWRDLIPVIKVDISSVRKECFILSCECKFF